MISFFWVMSDYIVLICRVFAKIFTTQKYKEPISRIPKKRAVEPKEHFKPAESIKSQTKGRLLIRLRQKPDSGHWQRVPKQKLLIRFVFKLFPSQ